MMGLFSSRIDAWVLAEGVETEAEAHRRPTSVCPWPRATSSAVPGPPGCPSTPPAGAVLADRAAAPGATLRPLLQRTPTVRRGEPLGDIFVDGVSWVVVIDDHGRPLGLVTPSSAVSGELLMSFRVGVDASPADVAYRLSTGADCPSLPAMVTDDVGRYLGVVPLRRLLGHLAAAVVRQ